MWSGVATGCILHGFGISFKSDHDTGAQSW